jgi:hypothetical protein
MPSRNVASSLGRSCHIESWGPANLKPHGEIPARRVALRQRPRGTVLMMDDAVHQHL